MSWAIRIKILTAAVHITAFSFASFVKLDALTAIIQILMKINLYL